MKAGYSSSRDVHNILYDSAQSQSIQNNKTKARENRMNMGATRWCASQSKEHTNYAIDVLYNVYDVGVGWSQLECLRDRRVKATANSMALRASKCDLFVVFVSRHAFMLFLCDAF